MNRKLAFASVLAILIGVVGVVWLRAAPNIGATAVTPTVVGANTPTQVTVTAQISDATLIPTSVNALKVDATGRVLANFGMMYDDGTNGDPIADDRIFSKRITVQQAESERTQIQVSASFRGAPRRVVSSVMAITAIAGQPLKVASLGVAVLVPSGWTSDVAEQGVVGDPTPSIVFLESSGGSQFLILPHGGEPYDVDDELVETVTEATVSGRTGIQRAFHDVAGNLVLLLVEFPERPDERIEFRVATQDDVSTLPQLLGSVVLN